LPEAKDKMRTRIVSPTISKVSEQNKNRLKAAAAAEWINRMQQISESRQYLQL